MKKNWNKLRNWLFVLKRVESKKTLQHINYLTKVKILLHAPLKVCNVSADHFNIGLRGANGAQYTSFSVYFEQVKQEREFLLRKWWKCAIASISNLRSNRNSYTHIQLIKLIDFDHFKKMAKQFVRLNRFVNDDEIPTNTLIIKYGCVENEQWTLRCRPGNLSHWIKLESTISVWALINLRIDR